MNFRVNIQVENKMSETRELAGPLKFMMWRHCYRVFRTA